MMTPHSMRSRRRKRTRAQRTLDRLRALRSNRRVGRSIPWGVSIALHFALVISAAFIAWRITDSRDDTPPLVVSFDEPAIAPAMLTPPTEQKKPDSEPAIQRVLAPPITESSAPAPQLPALPPPPPIAAPAVAQATPIVHIVQNPAARKVEFSGLGAADARDIVYVVDASGSMITSFPQVLAELRRSISKLHPTQRFQVFFFRSPVNSAPGQTAYVWRNVVSADSKPILIDATRRNKKAIFDWLNTISPKSMSNPLPALESALRLKPDAIFLLSSGATDPALLGASPEQVLAELDRLNPVRRSGRRRVVIQTIQILEADPLSLLKRIAMAHSGQSGYKFISRDDLIRQYSQNGDHP